MAITAFNDPNIINVKSLGAKGDGATDDSLAFQNAIAAAESAARRNVAPGSDANRLGTITIYVPAGSYVIKSAEAMIRSSYTIRTLGLQIVGAGAGMTQILFQPNNPGSYLMSNKDAWLFLHLADLTFDSNNSKTGLWTPTQQVAPRNTQWRDVCLQDPGIIASTWMATIQIASSRSILAVGSAATTKCSMFQRVAPINSLITILSAVTSRYLKGTF